jgi:serine protease Do
MKVTLRFMLKALGLAAIVIAVIGTEMPQLRAQDLNSLPELITRLKPSVVNISTTSLVKANPFPFGRGNDPFEEFFKRFFEDMPQREFRQRGLGSGFIISEDGYVVTNNHVIEKATDIDVILENGKKYRAEIVGKDPKTDVALLKIKPDYKLPAVKFGDSTNLQIGEWVIAIGNPFGLGHTVTTGIVSAKGRSLGLGAYDDFIQTDAAINPGNSGGPLFNLKGEVVGVNTAIIAGGQGIGFAIPIDMVKYLVEQLKTRGKVVRGWLGVLVQQITPEIGESLGIKDAKGALVSDVTPGGPADKAGIRRGDVIVEFNGNEIGEMQDLPKMVARYSPKDRARVKIIRNGKEETLWVTVGEMPDDLTASVKTGEDMEKNLGLTVQEINPRVKRELGIEEDKGVVVAGVEEGSLAYDAGIRQGDVILEVNKKPIQNLDDYRKAVETFKAGKSALFLVKRGQTTLYVAIRVDEGGKG